MERLIRCVPDCRGRRPHSMESDALPPVRGEVGAGEAALRITASSTGIRVARLVVFMSFLDLFLQVPIIAPYAQSLGASPSLIGIIVGIYSATNLIGNVLAGALLDRWGRKMPLLACLVLTALTLGAYAVARSPESLVGIRALHGLVAGGLAPGAFALIGDLTGAGQRGRVMGVSSALIAVAATIGPPLSGITRDRLGIEAVFLGGAALLLLTALVVARWGREPEALTERSRPRAADTGMLALLLRPRLVVAYLAALAVTTGVGTLVVDLPLMFQSRGESAASTGLAFAIYAVVGMAAMVTPLNRLSDHWGRVGPLALGVGLLSGGLLLLGTGSSAGTAVGMTLFGIGFGLFFPTATALVAEASRPTERGRSFGVFYAIYSLGVAFGSVLSGVAAEWAGEATGAPFLLGAVLALLIVPAILLLGRQTSRSG